MQVQGEQSALVAFSQQGSQLAGAFGPGDAIIGSVTALGSVVAGTLIASLNGGKNAMDALADATDALDKVITISQNGIAALSNKYANLARVNADVATLMRNQALLEYNQAIAKIPKAISDAAGSLSSFWGNISGGAASVKLFGEAMSTLNINTDNFSDAMQQASKVGLGTNSMAMTLNNTVAMLTFPFPMISSVTRTRLSVVTYELLAQSGFLSFSHKSATSLITTDFDDPTSFLNTGESGNWLR